MSFPTYINFQVNNTGGGRSNMVVHSHAVILMLLSLCPESFGIFQSRITLFKLLLKTLVKSRLECWVVSLNVIPH